MDVMTQYDERPPKRVRRTRKPPIVRRRVAGNMRRVKRNLAPGILSLSRLSNKNSTQNCHYVVTGDNTIPSNYFALTFALDDVNGVGELKSLFDNYRITKILYRFVMLRDQSQNGGAAGGNGLFPRVNWVHDFNDASAITRNQMMQHSAMKEFWFTENAQHSPWYTLRASSLAVQYEGTTASAYRPVWDSWVDTADSAMPHYGLKISYDQLYSGNTVIVEARYFIECKGIS